MYSASWLERVAWVVVLLLAIGVLCRGVYYSVKEYIDQPTITQISITRADGFPEVLLCDPYWMSEERMKQLGFTENFDVAMVGDLFRLQFTYYADWYDQAQLQEFLGKATGNFSTIDEFLEAIVAEPSEKMFSYSGKYAANQTNVLTVGGPCVLVQGNVSNSDFYGGKGSLAIFLDDKKKPFNATDVGNGMMYLRLGDYARKTFLADDDPILVSPGFMSHISVTAHKTVQLNSPDIPCTTGNAADHDKCLAKAMASICTEAGFKLPYLPGKGQAIDSVASWHWIANMSASQPSQPKECPAITEMESLLEECPVPCDTWAYDASVTLVNKGDETYSRLTIKFRNPKSVIVYQEEYVISPDMFISNLGGQVSLWSGASMITIVHAVLYCACRKPRKK